MSPGEAAPSRANVLAPQPPHQVDGEWRRRGRPALRRAFPAALAGVFASLIGASAWALKERR